MTTTAGKPFQPTITRKFSVGDLVQVDPGFDPRRRWTGVTFRVAKINKVNMVMTRVGGGQGLRAAPSVMMPATTTTGTDVVVTAVPLVDLPTLHPGQVVKISGAGWRQPAGKLWVITGSVPKGYRVALLGGDPAGRYFTGVPRSMITVVENLVISEKEWAAK